MTSFVAVLSNNLNESVYFTNVEEKGIAECELRETNLVMLF